MARLKSTNRIAGSATNLTKGSRSKPLRARSGRRASGPCIAPVSPTGKGLHEQMQPTHVVATQCSALPALLAETP
jgi:hypothetical protein